MKKITSGMIVIVLTFGTVDIASAETGPRPTESQPADAPQAGAPIHFEVAPQPRALSYVFWNAGVRYRVAVAIRQHRRVGPDARAMCDELLKTTAGLSVSDSQREMMQQTRCISDKVFSPSTSAMKYTLLAASEDDARKMVHALVQFLNSEIQTYAEQKGRAELQQKQQELRKAQEALEDVKAKLEVTSREFAQIQDTLAYRSWDDASQDILELDKALRAVEVDLAAIEAKTNTIKKIQEQVRAENRISLLPALDQMMFAQDIDRAGALARKAALELHRKRAHDYYQLWRKKTGLESDLQAKKRVLDSFRKAVAEIEDRLKPVEVVGVATIEQVILAVPRKNQQ